MRGTQRRLTIMTLLQKTGHVEVSELAEQFGVTTMTIRRDLTKLQDDGLVIMEYGGAFLKSGLLSEHDMSMKQLEHADEKNRIAKACSNYIKDGDSIFIDAGTTVAEITKFLSPFKNLTIMTHSLLAANLLSDLDVTLVMCPGKYRPKSMAFMGQLTDAFISNFRFDLLFLGVEGITEQGVFVPDITDGITKRNLKEHAARVICAADSSKINKDYHYRICELQRIDALVTDAEISEEDKVHLSELLDLVVV